MRNAKLSIIPLCALLLTLLLSGCGTSTKEGAASGTADTVAQVSETLCVTCHSTSLERLTGDPIVAKYETSVHNLNSVGCQDCHGGGAQHNGVGPIPFPSPNYVQCSKCHDSDKLVTNYAASKHLGVQIENEAGGPCQRCHTHQGAVLAAKFGFTGDKSVMAALVNAPGLISDPEPIKCNTCHVTHDTKTLRVDAGWKPSATVGSVLTSTNDQYRLCTQCHTYIDPDGRLVSTDTASTAAYEHDTSWFRIIATTHYDDPANPGTRGYNVRTTGSDPCFDCHGHEARTNTGNLTRNAAGKYVLDTTVQPTIYTDWAKSGHAAGILAAKYAAQEAYPKKGDGTYDKSTGMTVSVMMATVTAGAFAGHNTGSCSRCHTTEGFAYYNDNLTPTPTAVPAGVLKCYGCHTNAASGTLRTLKGAKATTNYTTDLGWDPTANFLASATSYSLNYGKLAYPDVAASNICIECHDSREKDPGAITDTSTNYLRTHYLQAAATMYVKMGFISFGTGTEPISSVAIDTSLLSDQDGGTITSTHRKLGTPGIIGDHGITAAQTNLTSNGPCVACHFNGGNHSLTIDQRTITAVCNNCHSSEGGHDITTIADFNQYFLEPQSEAYQAALLLAIQTFNDLNTGITITSEPSLPAFVRAYTTVSVAALTFVEAGSADWTAAATALGAGYNKQKVMAAASNIVFLKREPGAFAHARTYSRRLLYDTIDYLDNGKMDKSVSATALAKSAVGGSPVAGLFGKGTAAFTDSTLTTLSPGTTEGMVYLIKWSRTTGAWSTPERP
jgi:hypothetical protein